MTTWPLTALEACDLIDHGYNNQNALSIYQQISIGGVQAFILKGDQRVLLIQGTNEARDWTTFNFRFWPSKEPGDSRTWHKGFLEYARIIYAFSKFKQIDVVIGHSLGAAAAQMVGCALQLPTIAIASPRPLRDGPQPVHAGKIFNICRTDDTVCSVPPSWMGYGHVGKVKWMSPEKRHRGEDHTISNYRRIIEEQGDPLATTSG